MRNWWHRLEKKPGSSPGSAVLVGQRKEERTRLRLIRYDEKEVEEKECQGVAELAAALEARGVKWINVDGLHDVELIRQIGRIFAIHPLALEDILNMNQRPKVEPHDRHLYLTLKIFYAGNGQPEEVGFVVEQMSFILGENYVLSFQERVGQAFAQVRERIRSGGSGFIRKRGADYLLYALVDAVIDHYFVVLESIGERIEVVDEELNRMLTPLTLTRIHSLKKAITLLRKSAWPVREMANFLLRGESRLIRNSTAVFFRDVSDHTVQVLENLDGHRELVASMADLYQSSMGNRTNQVMKVLTIIATIFIPPTFVAGVYGMNFDNMPELHTRAGYYVVLGLMLLSVGAMLVYFKKKRWL